MTKAVYIPAIMPDILLSWNDKELSGKKINWWSENSLMKHDSALISAFYAMKNFKRPEDLRNTKLFIDSGGFQLITKPDAKIDPIALVKFQEENGDVGMVLDRPPVIMEYNMPVNQRYVTKEKLIKCAEFTGKNAEIMNKNRQREGFKLYNVLQGDNFDVLDTWWGYVKDCDLDGWCITQKPAGNIIGMTYALTYILSKNIKELHVLGTSSIGSVAVLAYAAKVSGINISFDSAGPLFAALRHKIYYLPYRLSNIYLGKRRTTFSKSNITDYPCNCPVCSFAKNIFTFETLNNLVGEFEIGSMVGLHNLCVLNDYFHLLNCIAEDKGVTFDLIRRIFGGKYLETIKKSIGIIDLFIEQDLDAVRLSTKKNKILSDYL